MKLLASGDNMRTNRFIAVQLLAAQMFMIFMKAYSLGTDKGFKGFLISFSFYIIVFIIPIILYLRCIDKVSVLRYLKLDTNVLSGIVKGFLIGSFIFMFFLIRSKHNGLKDIGLHNDIFILLGRIMVGPLEEIPFRGFYMQKFKRSMSFVKANFLSSLLFALIHINVMVGSVENLVYSLVYILVIGLWLGYIFEKTQSLWCASIVHSVYDISLFLLF